MRDLLHNVGIVGAIAPAVLDADNTPAAIDLLGFDSAVVVLHVGVGGITFTTSNKIEFKLTHSDDDVSYTAVALEDVLGLTSVGSGGIIHALTAAHAAPSVKKVGYVGGKRYLKLLADFSGTHSTGTPISATVIKGHAASRPVS